MELTPGIATLMREMPDGYENACYETGAIVRKRDVKNPDDLMMLNLFHLMTGCSLVEISAIASMAQIGEISDVAFMKRFKNCNEWFKWIIDKTVSQGLIEYNLPKTLDKYRVLALDASDVKEKGRSGRIFRLHFALDIKKMHAVLYNITTNHTGEKLSNFALSQGDLVLGDRAYGSANGVDHCIKTGAEYILRIQSNRPQMFDEQGNTINVLERISKSEIGDFSCFVKSGTKLLPTRVCFMKKSKEAIEASKKLLKKKEYKHQMKFSDKAKAFNNYVVVITSLGDEISPADVLDAYRYRWQVELYFKRLKSILDYGELPKKTEDSIFAWLNGKLMIALLIEKLLGRATFSPTAESFEEYLARGEDYEATVIV